MKALKSSISVMKEFMVKISTNWRLKFGTLNDKSVRETVNSRMLAKTWSKLSWN